MTVSPQRRRRVAAVLAGALVAAGAVVATATPADANGGTTVTVCKRWVQGQGCVETTTCRYWSTGEWECSDGTVSDRLPPYYGD